MSVACFNYFMTPPQECLSEGNPTFWVVVDNKDLGHARTIGEGRRRAN
jgi:hypothetical protein